MHRGAVAVAVVDKARHLTSNPAGSPPQPLGGAFLGALDGRVGDLKATQPRQPRHSSSSSLDPRPCPREPLKQKSGSCSGSGTPNMSSNPLKRSLDDSDSASAGAPTGPDAKRRKFRACVTCRRQKARCEFVNAHDRCHRCSVLQIRCVFEGHAHANLLAASSSSAPIPPIPAAHAHAQAALPFPHPHSHLHRSPAAVPSPYEFEISPQQLPRPSAGSEHATGTGRCVNPSSGDDQIRSLQRRLATIESALRACLSANRLADLETFSPQPHVQRNLHPAPPHKPHGEPSPASLHGAPSSSVSAHHTTMSHRSDLPLLGSEEATWRHPVKSTYMYFHGPDGPGVDNGRPPNPCGARILSDAQGDQLLTM